MMAGMNVVWKMLPQCINPLNDNHVYLIHLHMITFCENSLRMKCTPLGLEKTTTSSKECSKQSQWFHWKRCNEYWETSEYNCKTTSETVKGIPVMCFLNNKMACNVASSD
jgi:hypothetical protein